MGDKSQNIPLNARIVAKSGNSFMYQLPTGERFVYNSTTGQLRKSEAVDEIQLKAVSNTDFGGHNSEWATNAIISYRGKSLDSWWKQPKQDINFKASKPKKETPAYPESTFFKWAKQWKPGDDLPLMAPGMSMKMCHNGSGGGPVDRMRFQELDDLIKYLPLPNDNFKLQYPRTVQNESEKGLLGRSIREFSESLLGLAAAARGLYLDGKNKLRCGPGNPGANRFTNIFGIGCDIPGSPDGPDGSISAAAGSAVSKLNNDKTPDAPKFRRLSEVINSVQGNIRPLRYDKRTLSVFDDRGNLVGSGYESPDEGPVGRMLAPIVSDLTRIVPRNVLKERQARKKARDERNKSDLKTAQKSIPGSFLDKSRVTIVRVYGNLEERINANRRGRGKPDLRIDTTNFEQGSMVEAGGEMVYLSVPDGSGGFRPLSNIEVSILGYNQSVARLMEMGKSDKEIREARRKVLSAQLQRNITDKGLTELENFVSEILDAIARHMQDSSAENEFASVIPMRIYWGSEEDFKDFEDPFDEYDSGVLVMAMIPGQKNPFGGLDSIDADEFGNTFGISFDGVNKIRNRTLTPAESESLDLQLIDYIQRNLGLSGPDVDDALKKIKGNERILRGIMRDLNPPGFGVLMLNPRLFEEANLYQFMKASGEHYLVNGQPKNTSDFIKDTIDHELNHLNDYYNRIRTISNISVDDFQEILASGQPLNFRTLASYDPNSILAAQLRNLDLRVAAARDDIEKASVLAQWYMENYQFNDRLRKDYADWAKRKGYTNRAIQDVLDGIKDALGARGVNGDLEWWYQAFINSAGQNDPSFRTTPRDAIASDELWKLIYNIIGTTYGQQDHNEAMAELGAFIFNGDGVQQIRRWLTSSENTQFSNYTESQLLDILGLFLGEERVQAAFRNPGNTNRYDFKHSNVNIRNTALVLAPSKFHNYNNVKAQSISSFVGKSSIKALGSPIGSSRGRRIEPFRANAYDGDSDGDVQDGTIHERPGSPVGAMRAATNTATPDTFSPNIENRRARRNKIKKQKPDKRFSAVQSISTIASERQNSAGPIGRIEKYPLPRPTANDWLYDINGVKQKIDEIESKVDSMFRGKPKKLRHAMENIRSIVEMMNNSGINTEVTPSYFLLSSMPALKDALGGRYSGPGTPISPAELGAYYALMHHLMEYPEAFRDVSLDFSALNMPDQPAQNAPGGTTAILPTYMEFTQNRLSIASPGIRPDVQLPGLEGRVIVSDAGIDDMTQVGVSINPKLRRAKKGIMVSLPAIPYNQGKNPVFFVPGIGDIQLQLEEIPNGIVDATITTMLEMATNKDQTSDGIMDTTIATAVSQLSQEIANKYEEAMSLARQKPAQRNQIVSNATREAIDGFDEMLRISTFLVGVHEFGHLLDGVGNWRNSKNASNKNSGNGLNSAREFRLAVAELSAIESGMQSPFVDDIADTYATKFFTEQVRDAIQTKISHDQMIKEIPAMIDERNRLAELLIDAETNLSSSMAGAGLLDIRNSMEDALSSGSGIEAILNSILGSIGGRTQDESLQQLQEMRETLTVMDSQLMQAKQMMDLFQNKLQNLVPILKWLNNQTFALDRAGYVTTDILTGNKNAVDEFMQNFAKTVYGKNSWFDANGKFDKSKYVASVIEKVNDDSLYQQLLTNVTELINMQDNNGWKNLSDEEIEGIAALLPYISIYAGPAYYPGQKPAKNYVQSNAEGYAELHVAKILEQAGGLAQFSEQEKDLLDRLHSRMIEWASGNGEGM